MATSDESALPRGWRITYTDNKSEGYNSTSYRTFRLDRYLKVRNESPGAWFKTKVTEEWEWVPQHSAVTSSRDDDGARAQRELVKFALTQLDAEEFAASLDRNEALSKNLFPGD